MPSHVPTNLTLLPMDLTYWYRSLKGWIIQNFLSDINKSYMSPTMYISSFTPKYHTTRNALGFKTHYGLF